MSFLLSDWHWLKNDELPLSIPSIIVSCLCTCTSCSKAYSKFSCWLVGQDIEECTSTELLCNILAMRSIFYGRRIPTVFFSCRRKKIKIYSLAAVGKFELFSRDHYRLCKKKSPSLLECRREKKSLNVNFFSCREQFLVVGGLVAHRIYCAWPNWHIQGLNFSAVPRNSAVFPNFWIVLEISVNLPRKKITGGGVWGLHRHVIYHWKALDLTGLNI